MKTNDYRNTEYCPDFIEISKKKSELNDSILSEHPRVRIIYNQVNIKDTVYNKNFREIYNHKCGYCGVSQKILNAELYEIDHFICESSYNGDNETAGRIDNLVLSCKRCNRKKKNFEIDGDYQGVINPDDGSLAKVFYRNEEYYICVSEQFNEDETVQQFYKQLELENQVRRLDYLLMNMNGLYEQIKESKDGIILAQCINELQKKRNNH